MADEYTGAIVALIPAEDDPITAASSEPAHVTLVYMGDDASALDRDALLADVQEYAAQLTPITVPVQSRGPLGDEGADVVFLEPTESLLAVRDGALEKPAIRAAHDAVEQYPEWQPHVTLGYPETPAAGDYDVEQNPSVTFDRLGLWIAGERTDFPLSGGGPAEEEAVGRALTADMAGVIADEDEDEEPPVLDEIDPDDLEELEEIPVHGVLAPEGVPTGDGRMFAEGAMSSRSLPVPLMYEFVSTHGGNTSQTAAVGRVDEVWRDEATRTIRWRGVLVMHTRFADEVLQGIISGVVRGVSVDGDSAEATMAQGDDGRELTVFEKIRTAGLTIVPIPAYEEAYIDLGHEFVEDMSDEEVAEAEAILADCGCGETAFRDYSAEERREMADRGEAMEDGSFPIADEEDLRNAIQSIGRASDPDAARAHIRKRAKALGAEDQLPEDFALVARPDASFAPGTRDGPGWITHPRATARIRRYWTHGKGAAKIGWGTPGDWYRCRSQLRKYVQRPDWLAGLCSNMHKEATGIWPGDRRHPGRRLSRALSASATGTAAPLVRLVDGSYPTYEEAMEHERALIASAGFPVFDAALFTEPPLDAPGMTVNKETGHVYGYIAEFGVCHIGIPGVCTEAPRSAMDYKAFKTGVVETTEGPIRVGKLTAGVGHPDPRWRAAKATAHYDKTSAVRAYVNVGENSRGIWYSGVLAPGLSERQIDEFRAIGTLSGDWRDVKGNLELVAAVAVAAEGFPKVGFAVEQGEQLSLVAAGMIQPDGAPEVIEVRVEDHPIPSIQEVAREAAALLRRQERFRAAKAAIRPHRIAALKKEI